MADFSTQSKTTEEDVKARRITPAIVSRGWDLEKHVRMEYFFTDGRVFVDGLKTHRGKRKKADYLLQYAANLPLAVVEAKNSNYSHLDGIQQAEDYARILDAPFAYATNGAKFVERDMLNGTQREFSMDEFPPPEELWRRRCGEGNFSAEVERAAKIPYYYNARDARTPRYYQRIAVNRTVEAVAKGRRRVLLVMATGTGKTYTAFQITYRLLESGLLKHRKVLYLADRNNLVDQAMSRDFKYFGRRMTKITGRNPDGAYEVYMSLYQQLDEKNGEPPPYTKFDRGFFDLVIVDECHRGSAAEDSLWRGILEYFEPAVQIGMTATPKETKEVSNIDYFGEPVYVYNLKSGIEDGFLAPYKVLRVGLNTDLDGYVPPPGKLDEDGNEVENRRYNVSDFDRTLVIDERTREAAKYVCSYLQKTGPFQKTIIFCVDSEHAARMRQAVVEESSKLVEEYPGYAVRITSKDGENGKNLLEYFIDEESRCPVVVTTSKLLSTGVDCTTCKLVVIDKVVRNGIEFKQIIGRGTRLNPAYKKEFFTILDFRNATAMFNDPSFDGEPVSITEVDADSPRDENIPHPGGDTGGGVPADAGGEDRPGGAGEPSKKVRINGVDVSVVSERVQYLDASGKLVTELLRDFSKRNILNEYATLGDFLKVWNSAERKAVLVEELSKRGVLLETLRETSGKKDLDDFDLICHVAYDKPPLTRAERAGNVRKRGYLHKYGGLARNVLDALLEKYADLGVYDIENTRILENEPFVRMGGPLKIAAAFGGREAYLDAVRKLELEIYTEVA